jgi:hypothetical protein
VVVAGITTALSRVAKMLLFVTLRILRFKLRSVRFIQLKKVAGILLSFNSGDWLQKSFAVINLAGLQFFLTTKINFTMKAKFIAAILFAASFAIASCDRLTNKKDKRDETLLAGRYEIISVVDSPAKQNVDHIDTLHSFFYSSPAQTSKRYLDFVTDSMLTYETEEQVDSIRYYSDTSGEMVYIDIDGAYQPWKISHQDSTINLFLISDSISIALKKS